MMPVRDRQVAAIQAVYEERGAEGLAEYKVPLLTWQEVKELKGPGTIGLGLGGVAPGETYPHARPI